MGKPGPKISDADVSLCAKAINQTGDASATADLRKRCLAALGHEAANVIGFDPTSSTIDDACRTGHTGNVAVSVSKTSRGYRVTCVPSSTLKLTPQEEENRILNVMRHVNGSLYTVAQRKTIWRLIDGSSEGSWRKAFETCRTFLENLNKSVPVRVVALSFLAFATAVAVFNFGAYQNGILDALGALLSGSTTARLKDTMFRRLEKVHEMWETIKKWTGGLAATSALSTTPTQVPVPMTPKSDRWFLEEVATIKNALWAALVVPTGILTWKAFQSSSLEGVIGAYVRVNRERVRSAFISVLAQARGEIQRQRDRLNPLEFTNWLADRTGHVMAGLTFNNSKRNMYLAFFTTAVFAAHTDIVQQLLAPSNAIRNVVAVGIVEMLFKSVFKGESPDLASLKGGWAYTCARLYLTPLAELLVIFLDCNFETLIGDPSNPSDPKDWESRLKSLRYRVCKFLHSFVDEPTAGDDDGAGIRDLVARLNRVDLSDEEVAALVIGNRTDQNEPANADRSDRDRRELRAMLRSPPPRTGADAEDRSLSDYLAQLAFVVKTLGEPAQATDTDKIMLAVVKFAMNASDDVRTRLTRRRSITNDAKKALNARLRQKSGANVYDRIKSEVRRVDLPVANREAPVDDQEGERLMRNLQGTPLTPLLGFIIMFNALCNSLVSDTAPPRERLQRVTKWLRMADNWTPALNRVIRYTNRLKSIYMVDEYSLLESLRGTDEHPLPQQLYKGTATIVGIGFYGMLSWATAESEIPKENTWNWIPPAVTLAQATLAVKALSLTLGRGDPNSKAAKFARFVMDSMSAPGAIFMAMKKYPMLVGLMGVKITETLSSNVARVEDASGVNYASLTPIVALCLAWQAFTRDTAGLVKEKRALDNIHLSDKELIWRGLTNYLNHQNNAERPSSLSRMHLFMCMFSCVTMAAATGDTVAAALGFNRPLPHTDTLFLSYMTSAIAFRRYQDWSERASTQMVVLSLVSTFVPPALIQLVPVPQLPRHGITGQLTQWLPNIFLISLQSERVQQFAESILNSVNKNSKKLMSFSGDLVQVGPQASDQALLNFLTQAFNPAVDSRSGILTRSFDASRTLADAGNLLLLK